MSSAEKWAHGAKEILEEIERLLPERRWFLSSVYYYARPTTRNRLPVRHNLNQISIPRAEIEAWARAQRLRCESRKPS